MHIVKSFFYGLIMSIVFSEDKVEIFTSHCYEKEGYNTMINYSARHHLKCMCSELFYSTRNL